MKRVSRVEAKLARGEKVRVIIYCRVSTDKQEDEGSSLETQKQDCIAYAKERGYEVVGDVIEETHTGYELEQRKKFKKVIKRCTDGEADAIVFRTYDRLTRNKMHFTVISYDAERYGYELMCVKEQFDKNNIYDQILIDLMAAFAEIERMKIRERMTTGKIERVQSGKLLPTKKPRYGYAYEHTQVAPNKVVRNTHYKIVEKEEAIIHRVDELYLSGYSQQKIAKVFTGEGLITPMGNTVWNHTTIATILNCTEYHGEGYAYKTTSFVNEKGQKTWVTKPPEECIQLPESVYPIIRTKETYEAIQERLRTGHSTANTSTIPKDMLLRNGLIRCSICGRAMSGVMSRSHYNGTVYRYPAYICHDMPNGTHGVETVHTLQVVASTVEQATIDYVNELLQDLSVIVKALTDYVKTHSSEDSVESYDNAINHLKSRQEEIGEDLEFTRGNTRSILLGQMSKLDDEIEKLEEQKREIRDDDGWRWERIKKNINEVIEWLHSGDVDFNNATVEKKQDVMRALGIVVYATKGQKEEGKRRKNEYEIRVSLPTLDTHSSLSVQTWQNWLMGIDSNGNRLTPNLVFA